MTLPELIAHLRELEKSATAVSSVLYLTEQGPFAYQVRTFDGVAMVAEFYTKQDAKLFTETRNHLTTLLDEIACAL